MVHQVTKTKISERELTVVREYAKLRGWRLMLPDVANRVFYFRARNNKVVRRTVDEMVWHIAEVAMDVFCQIEVGLDDEVSYKIG